MSYQAQPNSSSIHDGNDSDSNSHPAIVKYLQSLYSPHTLSNELSQLLASDLTYRLKEIILEARKYRDFAKRDILTVEDINRALTSLNMKPTYGYRKGTLQFNHIPMKNIFYIPTRELSIREQLKIPLQEENLGGVSVASHWLAVEGVQPKIPQNPLTETIMARERSGKLNRIVTIAEERGLYVHQFDSKNETKLVKHQLTQEQRLYYKKVTNSMNDLDKPLVRKQSLISLQRDLGLHQLVPYFSQYIADEVAHNLTNLPLLYNLMEMTHALLLNQNIHIELYLHQLIPSIITCIVTESACVNPIQNHWKLRNYAAEILSIVVKKYSESYENLETRILRTLMLALLGKDKPRSSQYGAIVAIKALGAHAVKMFLLEPLESSNLRVIVATLLPDLKHKDMVVRYDAQMCYSALMECCSVFFSYVSRFLRPQNVLSVDDVITTVPKPLSSSTKKKETHHMIDDDEVILPHVSLSDRLASFAVLPEDIHVRYQELYDIFGDGVLPYIPYDAYSNATSHLAMNFIL